MLSIPKLFLSLVTFVIIGIACTLTTYADPVVINGNFNTFVPSNGTGGGWTTTTIDGNGGHRTTGGNPGSNFIINHNGQLATDPSISQLVSGFTVGESYTLTGDYAVFASSFGNPALQSFAVDVVGIGTTTFGRPGGEGVYGSFSVTFTANATDVLIRLRTEINGDDSSFRVDNIAITAAPVPEPATLLLLGTGLAGFAGAARRRRTKP